MLLTNADILPFLVNLTSDDAEVDCTRRMARTQDDRLAWVPAQAQTGDVVCYIKGAPFPLVFQERSAVSYAVVGDAYLQPSDIRPDVPKPVITFRLR